MSAAQMDDRVNQAYYDEVRRYQEHEMQRQMEAQLMNPSWIMGTSPIVIRKPPPDYEGAYVKAKECKACGSKGAKSEYVHDDDHNGKDISHMRRTCKNCGHVWKEIPKYLIPQVMADKMSGETK